MSKINDGGAAFPRPLSARHEDEIYWPQSGMSLRDWFAGQAMAAIISKMPLHGFNHSAGVDHIPVTDGRRQIRADLVRGAYNYADAMLVARQSQEGEDA